MEDPDIAISEKVSEFHGAFAQLRRIDLLWQLAHRDVRNGNYLNWNICLDRLWMEFVGDLDENCQEEKDMDKINKELIELQPLISTLAQTWNKKADGYDTKLSKQYLLLCKKEIFIRRVQNKLGKGTRWRDEFEDDLE